MAEFKSELIVLHVYPFLRSLQSQKALFTEGNSFSNIQEEFWHVYQPGCSEGIWVVVGFYVGLRIVDQLSRQRQSLFPVSGTCNPFRLSRLVVSRKLWCAD